MVFPFRHSLGPLGVSRPEAAAQNRPSRAPAANTTPPISWLPCRLTQNSHRPDTRFELCLHPTAACWPIAIVAVPCFRRTCTASLASIVPHLTSHRKLRQHPCCPTCPHRCLISGDFLTSGQPQPSHQPRHNWGSAHSLQAEKLSTLAALVQHW